MQLATLQSASARAGAEVLCQPGDTVLNFGKVDPLAGGALVTEGQISLLCTGGAIGEGYEIKVSTTDHAGLFRSFRGGNSHEDNDVQFELFSDRNLTRPIGRLENQKLVLRGNFDESGQVHLRGEIFGRVWVRSTAAIVGERIGSIAISFVSPTGVVVGSSVIHISIDLVASCIGLTAEAMDFGVLTDLSGGASTTSVIGVQCTTGTPVKIGIGPGLHADPKSPARYLSDGKKKLAYQLYTDRQQTKAWGSMETNQAMEVVGTGKRTVLSVFGYVFPNADARSGVYHDRVTVTVSY